MDTNGAFKCTMFNGFMSFYFCKCVSVNIFKFQYRLKVPILNSDGYLFSHMPIQQIPAMLMGLIHTQVSQIISIQPLFFIFVHISKELSFFLSPIKI